MPSLIDFSAVGDDSSPTDASAPVSRGKGLIDFDAIVSEKPKGSFAKARQGETADPWAKAVEYIKPFIKSDGVEGFNPKPFHFGGTGQDIGYGTPAQPGDTEITPEEADRRLTESLGAVASQLSGVITNDKLTDKQRGALVSLVYNLQGDPTKAQSLIAQINSGDTEGAQKAFRNYTHADGKYLAGLDQRRYREAALFGGGEDPGQDEALKAVRGAPPSQDQEAGAAVGAAGGAALARQPGAPDSRAMLASMPGASASVGAGPNMAERLAADIGIAKPGWRMADSPIVQSGGESLIPSAQGIGNALSGVGNNIANTLRGVESPEVKAYRDAALKVAQGQPRTSQDQAALDEHIRGQTQAVLDTALPGSIANRLADPAVIQGRALKTVANRLAQSAEGGGLTAEQAIAELEQARGAGKPLALADVGGQNVQGLLGVAARTPGAGKEQITDFLRERSKGTSAGVMNDIDANLAAGQSNYVTEQALSEAQSKAARPLYEAARDANPAMRSDDISAILNTPSGKDALAAAKKKMADDRVPAGPEPPDGSYSLQTLDYVKRALDDRAGAAVRSGEKNDARIFSGLSSDLRTAMDAADASAAPGKPGLYQQARRAFSGPEASKAALEEGRLFEGKDPQQIADEMSKMTDADKDFYRLGVANRLKDKAGKSSTLPGLLRSLETDVRLNDQLRPIFRDQESLTKFLKATGYERSMRETEHAALGNSATAARLAEDEGAHLDNIVSAGEAARDMAHGNVIGLAKKAKEVVNWLEARRAPLMYEQIGKILTDINLAATSPTGIELLKRFPGSATQKALAAQAQKAALQNQLAAMGRRAPQNMLAGP